MNEPQPFPTSPTEPPRTSLAITSLVLGILSVACFIAGIPAIITGHVARGRARREPALYGGEGFALAGLIMGYIGIALAVVMIPLMAALIWPALAKAKGRAQTVQCVNNMKQVGLAARMWSSDHNAKFPPDFLSMSNELSAPRILICPGDQSKTPAADWSQFDPNQNVSYEFLTPNANENEVLSQTAFQCPIHGNIGLGDGSVQQKSGGGDNHRRQCAPNLR
jgi:hypothetical protein